MAAMPLKAQLEAEAGKAAVELFDHPTEHDRVVALALLLRGAEITLDYIKTSGLVGLVVCPGKQQGSSG